MSQKLTRYIALYGVGVYLLALLVISLVFHEYALQLKWMLWGIGEVLFFFVLTTVFYPRWKNDTPKQFWLKGGFGHTLALCHPDLFLFQAHDGFPLRRSGRWCGLL